MADLFKIEKGETETTITMTNEEAQLLRDIMGATSYATARQIADGEENGTKTIDSFFHKLHISIIGEFPKTVNYFAD